MGHRNARLTVHGRRLLVERVRGQRSCIVSVVISERLAVDRERARAWAIGQTVAWSIEGTVALDRHVETATWLLESAE